MIVLLYSSILGYETYLLLPIQSGIGIYGGLYQVSSLTQTFVVFISILSIIILQLSSFYYRHREHKGNILNKKLDSDKCIDFNLKDINKREYNAYQNQHYIKLYDLLEKSSLLRKGKRFYQSQNQNSPLKKFSDLLKNTSCVATGKIFYSRIKGNFNTAIFVRSLEKIYFISPRSFYKFYSSLAIVELIITKSSTSYFYNYLNIKYNIYLSTCLTILILTLILLLFITKSNELLSIANILAFIIFNP